jgi:hypothetical protein
MMISKIRYNRKSSNQISALFSSSAVITKDELPGILAYMGKNKQHCCLILHQNNSI